MELTENKHLEPLWCIKILTDNGDAAIFGRFHNFVHQVFGSMREVVPLEHPDRTVPHNLLGSAYSLCVELWALGTTIQTLDEKMSRMKTCLKNVCFGFILHKTQGRIRQKCIALVVRMLALKCVCLTIQPAGIPSATVAVPVAAFSSNLSAVMKSTGSAIFTPFFLALAIRSFTILAPSSSYREVPIWAQENNILNHKMRDITTTSSVEHFSIIGWHHNKRGTRGDLNTENLKLWIGFLYSQSTHLHVIKNLEEGKRHSSTNDHLVHLIQHVVDQLNLIFDLSPVDIKTILVKQSICTKMPILHDVTFY